MAAFEDELKPRPPGWRWWCGTFAVFMAGGLVTSLVPLVGVIVFFAGVAGLMATARLRKKTGLQSLALALAANGFVLGHSLWLFTFPGRSIRPMMWNAEILLVGVVCVLWVGVLALLSVWKERAVVVPVLAFLAVIEALLMGWQILAFAAHVRGFRIAE